MISDRGGYTPPNAACVDTAALDTAALDAASLDTVGLDAAALDGAALDAVSLDALVVGAGVAGLACAAELQRAGRSVAVLEAGPQIGGRIRSLRMPDGEVWELGAQVVHGSTNPIWDVLGPGARGESFRSADFRCILGGRTVDLAALASLGPPPWSVNLALGFGSVDMVGTVADWLRERALPTPVRRLTEFWLEQDWAAEPVGLDCGELGRVVAGRRPAVEEHAVCGGFDALPAKLAAGLAVRLNTPARRIEHAPGGVRVRTDSATLTARTAVIAVPPWTVGPGGLMVNSLSAAKLSAVRLLSGGDAIVAVVGTSAVADRSASVFDADGGCGFFRSRAGSGRVQIVAKGSGARRVRMLLEDSRRLGAVLGISMPWAHGADITSVDVQDWADDPYIAGAFTVPAQGSGPARRVWAAPVAETLFFAGESTCAEAGVGRVHGALVSGRRAAAEVLEALGPSAVMAGGAFQAGDEKSTASTPRKGIRAC